MLWIVSTFVGPLMLVIGFFIVVKQKNIKGIKDQKEKNKEKIAMFLISFGILLVIISIKFFLDSRGVEIVNTPLN
ncbi:MULTISPECIES: hypothetical protein [Vagococcus]|uniref:Uncharacterized protein n=1 Tax=Vagococcus fluvialis bH819 TaxID=1255619 RepID=A0A1X6WMA9_9ENTE|nr:MULTISPECIES: hypothetical protein [Vagococcus]SLM85481.1 hypothetical protein FM121_05235 [Vagococcus fluvialis bH819]HCM89224.1 hypothetical protein [Vagococcus sp.]